jgi:hypothetical protein
VNGTGLIGAPPIVVPIRETRRITDEHRLVHTVRGENLIIVQARYHY